jgi:hypothetical protein
LFIFAHLLKTIKNEFIKPSVSEPRVIGNAEFGECRKRLSMQKEKLLQKVQKRQKPLQKLPENVTPDSLQGFS